MLSAHHLRRCYRASQLLILLGITDHCSLLAVPDQQYAVILQFRVKRHNFLWSPDKFGMAYRPNASWPSSTIFNVRMIPTVAHPTICVRRALAKLFITETRLVRISKGMRANGNAKLSTT